MPGPAVRRCGFTLIELLVTTAIIAILVSLLLPAVMAVRETSRRSQCRNNLRQIGVAIASYHDTFAMLPAGCVNPRGPIAKRPAGFHHSWTWAILPHLDQTAAARQLNQNLGAYDPANRPVAGLALPVLFCPSDMSGKTSIDRVMRGAGLTNFAGVHHPVEAPIDTNNHGSFYVNSFLRSEEIADGMSSTIGVGEIIRDPTDLGWVSGTRATLRNAGSSLNPKGTPRRPYANDPATIVEPDPTIESGTLVETFPLEPTEVEEEKKPVEDEGMLLRPPAPAMAVNADYSVGGFASEHSGGAQFLMLDGACRFISQSLSPGMLEQLADRADGGASVEF
jgi:prepilin-type N-terminal cleavage/methylation domain-containing protein